MVATWERESSITDAKFSREKRKKRERERRTDSLTSHFILLIENCWRLEEKKMWIRCCQGRCTAANDGLSNQERPTSPLAPWWRGATRMRMIRTMICDTRSKDELVNFWKLKPCFSYFLFVSAWINAPTWWFNQASLNFFAVICYGNRQKSRRIVSVHRNFFCTKEIISNSADVEEAQNDGFDAAVADATNIGRE